MSAQAAYRYGNYGTGTYGPAPERFYEPEFEQESIPQEQPEVKAAPKTRAKEKAQVQTRYGISLFGIAGSAIACVLLLFVVIANVKLSEVSFQNAALETRVQQLQEDERRLLIRHEQAFDINQIELYATAVLGMTRPAEGQVGTIDATANADRVVIFEDDSSESGIGGFTSFLKSLMEYFG